MPWTPRSVSRSISSKPSRVPVGTPVMSLHKTISRRPSRTDGPGILCCTRLAGSLLAVSMITTNAWAGNISISIQGTGTTFNIGVPSQAEARWDSVIRQKYDFSCGSAAVATLLTYHYEMPTSEQDVFQAMFRDGDKKKIQTEGFSMLDMKRYLDKRGMRSDGFRMTLDQLSSVGVPGIALVNTRGYRHFVIIRGIDDERVLLGDPAAGDTAISREYFEQIWSGAVLAAREKREIAQRFFNNERDWRTWPSAPTSQGLDRTDGLGMFLLTLPGPNELGI
jgi:predicted double-glycine peptidase